MIKSFFTLLIAIHYLLPLSSNAQTREAEIDNLYQVKQGEPGFSIAVYQADCIVFQKEYGIASLDDDRPITPETVFDVGSIGKQFTAAAILLLEEEGKLSIKDPAYQYLDNLPRYNKGNPSIEHLLNQTSGIKEVDYYLELADLDYRDYLSQSQLINLIVKVPELMFAPGSYFHYTNANYILLASIIERASGQAYEDYLQENIFGPLGMRHTLVDRDAYRTVKNRAIGYTENEGQYYKTHLYFLKFVGDGQIVTNARDMFRWHLNLRHATIGSAALWQKMHTKAVLNDGTPINYGLGVEFETHHGYEAVGFDGMIKLGFVSKYLYFPEVDFGFFTTQNTFDWDFKERFFRLVNLYIPAAKTESRLPTEIQLSESILKQYEGNYLFYRHDVDRKLNTIKLLKDQLYVLTIAGDEIARLVPIGQDRFLFGENGEAVVEFSIDGDHKQYTYDEQLNEMPWRFEEYSFYQHNQRELQAMEGQYYNEALQVSKTLRFTNGKLYFYYRNGAWKDEVSSLTEDLLALPVGPTELVRDDTNQLTGIRIKGLYFKKL